MKHITKNDLIGWSSEVKELATPFVKKEAITILQDHGFDVCSTEYLNQLLIESLELGKLRVDMDKLQKELNELKGELNNEICRQ